MEVDGVQRRVFPSKLMTSLGHSFSLDDIKALILENKKLIANVETNFVISQLIRKYISFIILYVFISNC